uniref:Uncharacterized protein n=1 Tax=Tetranychus urticae TaxID=32264 RepID=T1K5R6_TETUR
MLRSRQGSRKRKNFEAIKERYLENLSLIGMLDTSDDYNPIYKDGHTIQLYKKRYFIHFFIHSNS